MSEPKLTSGSIKNYCGHTVQLSDQFCPICNSPVINSNKANEIISELQAKIKDYENQLSVLKSNTSSEINQLNESIVDVKIKYKQSESDKWNLEKQISQVKSDYSKLSAEFSEDLNKKKKTDKQLKYFKQK